MGMVRVLEVRGTRVSFSVMVALGERGRMEGLPDSWAARKVWDSCSRRARGQEVLVVMEADAPRARRLRARGIMVRLFLGDRGDWNGGAGAEGEGRV